MWAIVVAPDIFREFYVRGLDRHWYCALPASIGEVESANGDDELEGGEDHHFRFLGSREIFHPKRFDGFLIF